jgi:TATA-box binding protein (TBP) (component of TFIID and TFIIIB)
MKCAMGEVRTRPVVYNLKVHILLTKEGAEHLKNALKTVEAKFHNNFAVVRAEHTYIIFPEKGFVNITGIKGFSQLDNVITQFCQVFNLVKEEVASEIIVDNVSAAGDFARRVNLVLLQQTFNKQRREGEKTRFFSAHFDRNFFPGAACKTRGFGTLTVFTSGKYVIVGAKCMEHVERLFQEMSAAISKL